MLLCLFLSSATIQLVSAKDTWTSVRSKNFSLVGNASEKEIRQVAMKLEQFRHVFRMLFPKLNFNSPVPTTVIVFKNNNSYKPFKTNPNLVGYFQSGPDVNYITLAAEQRHGDSPYAIIFHEYVHLLLDNTLGDSVPRWFNEGMAEYYSTFEMDDAARKVILGSLISNHVLYLRDQKLLPLQTLFEVDEKSPYYNESNKMNVFYAESWMLIHYLLQGKNGQRRGQLAAFVNLLTKKVPVDEAFKQAFQIGFEDLEKEFKSYISGARYMATSVTFKEPLVLDSEMQASPLSEAEANAYLADLLLHTNRPKEAESYLQQALVQDPNLAMAHASLGMLRFRERRFAEARSALERAINANSNNYLAHYYYAFVLSKQGDADQTLIFSYPPETAKTIQSELKKAIALKPDFPESYSLSAFVKLVMGEELDEAVKLIEQALKLSPGKTDFSFTLAQIHMRKEDFTKAREILEPLAQRNDDPAVGQQARGLLEGIKKREQQRVQFEAWKESKDEISATQTLPVSSDPWDDLRAALRPPAAGEVQVQGALVRIDCAPRAIVLTVKTGDRLLKIKTEGFEHIDITTFSPDIAGEIQCGPRKPENVVVVCYVPSKDSSAKVDGIAKSLEFVPKDFKLTSEN